MYGGLRLRIWSVVMVTPSQKKTLYCFIVFLGNLWNRAIKMISRLKNLLCRENLKRSKLFFTLEKKKMAMGNTVDITLSQDAVTQ